MKILDFVKFVLPAAPGCPTPVAKQAVLDAAIEFLTYTQVWDEVQDPVSVQDGTQDYDMDAPTGAVCIDLKAVYRPVGELRGVDMSTLSQLMPDWQTSQGSTPQLYTRAVDFSSIRVFPIPVNPGESETLRMHGVYTLKDSATTIPDDIVTRYRAALEHGAKYRLLVMPKSDWQDLKLAKYHKDEFDNEKSMARITAAHGRTAGSARARPRPFGR